MGRSPIDDEVRPTRCRWTVGRCAGGALRPDVAARPRTRGRSPGSTKASGPSGSGRPSRRTTSETTKRPAEEVMRGHSRCARLWMPSPPARAASASPSRSLRTKLAPVGAASPSMSTPDEDPRRTWIAAARSSKRQRPPCAVMRSTRNSSSSSSPRASVSTPRVHAPCRRATANGGGSDERCVAKRTEAVTICRKGWPRGNSASRSASGSARACGRSEAQRFVSRRSQKVPGGQTASCSKASSATAFTRARSP